MKKLITKYWGLVLVVVLLSTLFIGTAAPANAADYAVGDSLLGPYAIPIGQLSPINSASFGIADVAQSGSTIYALSTNQTLGYFGLYKSKDNGATWVAVTTGIVAVAQNFTLVAVAPDNPDIVCLVDTAAPAVYYSATGGTLFSSLGNPGVGALNDITISTPSIFRYITVGGANGVSTWTLGLAAPAWVPNTQMGTALAVAYSPSFAADASLLAVTTNLSTNATTICVYSSNLLNWNPTGYGYPITIDAGSANAPVVNKATITLDPNFALFDAATQIGFIGIAGTRTGNAAYQGVYRFDLNNLGTAAQIFSTTGVNSIAWDGTNLMIAPYRITTGSALTIYRSANALATFTIVGFLPSSVFKTPGTGILPLVLFAGGNGFAFSQGPNSAIAKSTDLGKSFNGVALINSNFGTITDFWVSPDGSRIYATVDDGRDLNVWRADAGVWQRVFILSAGTGSNYIVRADADVPDTVYIGSRGGTTMYKSSDAGNTLWTTRASSTTMADFVVQDANTLYLASSATDAWVYKSTNGAFTWTPYATGITSGVGFSMTLIADNQILMGTNNGLVAYTSDGTTWAYIIYSLGLTAGNTIAVADKTTAGGTIYAAGAGNAASSLNSWTLGTNVVWTPFVPTANITGLALANGVVYAYNDTANYLYRWLNDFNFILETGAQSPALAISQTNAVTNTLRMSKGSTVLWARNVGAVDNIVKYSSYIDLASNAPVAVAPINGTKIPVNSLSGNVQAFTFQWQAPPALATTPTLVYSYDINVYLDEAGTILAGGNTFVGTSIGGVIANIPSALSGATFQAGTTYYWQVRVTSPQNSYFCPMQSFVVGALQAVVPTLNSPINGASIAAGQTAAFSWTPITGATSYSVQVSTDPAFATTLYTTTTASAGAAVPSTVKLTAGTTYYWRVKALAPTEGDWSTVANFTVAAPVTTQPPITIPPQVTPTITVVLPSSTSTVITVPGPTNVTNQVNPSYIWAVIIIGAVLVIAVIVLIVRTRRSV